MHARNAGLQRLRSVTRRVGIVTAALTAVFAGLAAASNSGKHHPRVVRRAPRPQAPAPVARTARVPPPPALPSLSSEEGGGEASSQPSAPSSSPSPSPSPQPPPAPPAQVQEPPVVVSGGS
jgi:hypothetical protein